MSYFISKNVQENFSRLKYKWWTYDPLHHINIQLSVNQNKVVVVTGPTSGIGKEVVKKLMNLNYRVILACRNTEKGRAVAQEMGIEEINVLYLDLSKKESIDSFAVNLHKLTPHINVLINNAAYLGSDLELMYRTNCQGPTYLTKILLPHLNRSFDGKVINVSSVIHAFAKPTLENLYDTSSEDQLTVYANTKLYNILLTNVINKLPNGIDGQNVPLVSTAVNPGYVDSDLYRSDELHGSLLRKMKTSAGYIGKSAEEGARQIIYAIVRYVPYRGYISNFSPDSVHAFSGVNLDLLSHNLWNNTEFEIGNDTFVPDEF